MVAMNMNAPCYTIAADTSSKSATLVPQDANAISVIISNAGTTPVFVVSGKGSAPTAVYPASATVPVAGMVILPGVTGTYSKQAGDNFISAIRASGTGDVYLNPAAGE